MTRDLVKFTDHLVKAGFSYQQASVLQKHQEEILSSLRNCGQRQKSTEVTSSNLLTNNDRSVLVEKRHIADLSERLGDLTRELKDQAHNRKLDQICIITVLIVALIGFIFSRQT